MLLPYSAIRPTIRSGDILAWRRNVPHAYNISLYQHVAVAWVIGGRVLLLEANRDVGALITVASQRVTGIVDLIRTSVNFNSSVEHYALAPIGRGFSFLAPMLAALSYDVRRSDIESLYCAAVLRRAGVHLFDHGYTPQSLIDDLVSMGDQIQRLDCRALENASLARIVILDSKGNPMSSASIPRDNIDTFPLSFLDAAGKPVSVPSDVSVQTSDGAVATVALVTNSDNSDSIVVTPVANGNATITVSSGSISATVDVTVADPALGSIVIGDGVLTPAA